MLSPITSPSQNGGSSRIDANSSLLPKRHLDGEEVLDDDEKESMNTTRRCKLAKTAKVDSDPSDVTPSSNSFDENYFRSYAFLDIHETMIADDVRTTAYGLSLLHCHEQLRGGIVADVGCGTGILSLFACQAGAAKVLAIEASGVADVAQRLVKDNKMERKIQVINERAEDVVLDRKVDALVSEWMGYCLLYENMLESVISFRDTHLKEDGLIFPCSASLLVAAYHEPDSLKERNLGFWQDMSNMYKLNLHGCLADAAYQRKIEMVTVESVIQENIMSHAAKVVNLDLLTVRKEDLKSLSGPFSLSLFGESTITSLVLWFEVGFPDSSILSTSPYKKSTHWEQCQIFLDEPVPVTQNTVINGTLTFSQATENKRFLNIHLLADFLEDGIIKKHFNRLYKLHD